MNNAELVVLCRIYNGTCYARGVGPANHAIIQAAAEKYGHRPEVIAGLLMRESRGGEALDANGRGDEGHGCGLMQIDERWFPAFCESALWRDPGKNIDFGAYVLHAKRGVLIAKSKLHGQELERASIAAYNCGEGNVLKAIASGEDPDSRTTGRDFAKSVLEYADAYRRIACEPEVLTPLPTEPDPPVRPPDPSGLLAVINKILQAIFGVRHG